MSRLHNNKQSSNVTQLLQNKETFSDFNLKIQPIAKTMLLDFPPKWLIYFGSGVDE